DAAPVEYLAHPGLDRRVADLAGDPQLVASGEEDACGAVEERHLLWIVGFRAFVDVELPKLGDAEPPERPFVHLVVAVRLMAGDRGQNHDAAIQPAGDLLQDDAIAV